MLRCPYSSIHSRLTVPCTSLSGAATSPVQGCSKTSADAISAPGPPRRALFGDRGDPVGCVVTVIDPPVYRQVGLAHDSERVALRRPLGHAVDLLDRLKRQ